MLDYLNTPVFDALFLPFLLSMGIGALLLAMRLPWWGSGAVLALLLSWGRILNWQWNRPSMLEAVLAVLVLCAAGGLVYVRLFDLPLSRKARLVFALGGSVGVAYVTVLAGGTPFEYAAVGYGLLMALAAVAMLWGLLLDRAVVGTLGPFVGAAALALAAVKLGESPWALLSLVALAASAGPALLRSAMGRNAVAGPDYVLAMGSVVLMLAAVFWRQGNVSVVFPLWFAALPWMLFQAGWIRGENRDASPVVLAAMLWLLVAALVLWPPMPIFGVHIWRPSI